MTAVQRLLPVAFDGRVHGPTPLQSFGEVVAHKFESPESRCGFNRWTQQIGEIVQRVFRSLAFSLGGY